MRDTVQTNKIIIGTLVIGFVLMISGCKQGGVAKLNDQEEKVLEFFFNNKVGSEVDYAVFKVNSPPSYPVIVVFGFYENLTICNRILDQLNISEPNSYDCRPVNH